MTDRAQFEAVDWDDDGGSQLDAVTALRLVPLVAVVAAYAFDGLTSGALVLGWYPSPLDWLTMFALAMLAGIGLPALVRNPDLIGRVSRQLRSDPVAFGAFALVVAAVLVAALQPLVIGIPTTEPPNYQPPAFTVSDNTKSYTCLGQFDPYKGCQGTLEHPLGTDKYGRPMTDLLANAIHISVKFALITLALVAPLGVAVGTVAGYVGGRVDEVLMRYVDVQQTVPAFIAYVIVGYATTYSLWVIAVVFGLFSWGGLARMVRSEVLQRKEAAFVTAARNAGASHVEVVRRHILPNVSGTALTGLTLQIPTLILTEAAVAYLGLGDIDRWSFGTIINDGVSTTNFMNVWWVAGLAALALMLFTASVSVLGDALRDAFDPGGAV